jgi:hypothetical protein
LMPSFFMTWAIAWGTLIRLSLSEDGQQEGRGAGLDDCKPKMRGRGTEDQGIAGP